ncbi:unnamed protein product [Diatraea saccharalis]|uniref:Down syndrome cell adhesion molecule-like protein Dscam2 n=1 Tax=Diatraea saccharalis TaxID=40085 RepID=A0A9N9WF75_9NEOP|nr:unnamed protein product [Diatraea saccharalis]
MAVVAGVGSLGGAVSVGVGSSLLLVCACVGAPPPRTVWYHQHNIITHHPRFTRNHDDSLLINNIDQSLSGNYTCLAKNLYGSDSVEYQVIVLPLPESPVLRATPYKDSILVEWEQPYYSVSNRSVSQKITYSLTWKEANGPWREAWPANKLPNLSGVQKYVLTDLKCGTKYSLRITATNKVGTSQPAYLDVSTLGGVPIPPSSNEWLWSNSSHLAVQLAGWDDGGCALRAVEVDHRRLGARHWLRAPNTQQFTNLPSWSVPSLYQAKSPYHTGSFVIADLSPGTWYQVRIAATNEAGTVTTTYSYATKNEDGSEVGPPSELFDLNMLVIVCSSILLTVCLLSCIYILVKRQRSGNLTEYRDSITVDNKSESGNLTANTSHTNLANVKENAMNAQNRIYSAPIHLRNNSKHGEMEIYNISILICVSIPIQRGKEAVNPSLNTSQPTARLCQTLTDKTQPYTVGSVCPIDRKLYEISPYAQFAVGFRTFGHVENQDMPNRHIKHARYDTETSFQVCSESEDSDSVSKSTLKSVPRSELLNT